MNERRALSHVGGEAFLRGDAPEAQGLAEALDVQTSGVEEDEARGHVHGFHSYPARMHPTTARRLVERFSAPGETVLDPFCGSGTVLVEARLAGRRAVGVDANPLAVRLATLKARGSIAFERAAMVEAAAQVAAVAEARRKAKAGPTHLYGRADIELFDIHVLLELDSLRLGLDQMEDEVLREDLELVLSSILTKVSRRVSDTSSKELPRRIAAGYPTRLFVKKTQELASRLAEVADELSMSPAVTVIEGDARARGVVPEESVDLIVTSPPYPGVYDYLAHHEARLRWLRMSVIGFERSEIGARRRLDPLGPREALTRWRQELGASLQAMFRALRPSGMAALLIADSVVAGEAAYADDLVGVLAQEAGLELVAGASQSRPYFHGPTAQAFGDRPRYEHALLVARPAAVSPRRRV